MMKLNQYIEKLFSRGILLFLRLSIPYLWCSLANIFKKIEKSSKVVFCTLDDEFLFRDDDGNGRYAYLPLYLLSQIGYSIYFYKSVNFLEFKRLGYCGRYIYSIKNLKFISEIPTDTSEMIYLFDEPRPELLSKTWKKLVYINILRPAHFKFGQVIVMPFFMHPMQYMTGQLVKIPTLRKMFRKMRIFFGGNTNKNAYQGKSVPQYGQLTRHEATELIINSIKEVEIITKLNIFTSILQSNDFVNKFLLLRADESGQQKTAEWLATIAQSQFFMCFSGTDRPICHNAVEAMSVGTIPIISYQDWFFPSLEHLKNAIVYSGKDDLIAKIHEVFKMSPERVQEMSRHVMEYYDQYLTTEHFRKQFDSNTDPICTLTLFPRIICSAKDEARLKPIKTGIEQCLHEANVPYGAQ